MARKRRRGRHNTGGGRQPRQRLLDTGRTDLFLYDARRILSRDGALDEDQHTDSIIQALIAKGSRQGLDDAREYAEDLVEQDMITEDACKDIQRILERYSKMR